VFLAGRIVAMVTYSATKLTATYSPMIVQFVDSGALAREARQRSTMGKKNW